MDNRVYRFSCASRPVLVTDDGFVGPIRQNLEIVVTPPFTIEFDINRTNLADPSQAIFHIYNLAPVTRGLIRKDYTDVTEYRGIEFWGGYGTFSLNQLSQAGFQTLSGIGNAEIPRLASEAGLFPRLFRGNITRAYSQRKGTTFVTTIEASDGGLAFLRGYAQRVYDAGTPHRKIIMDMIDFMPGIQVGAIGNFPDVLLKKETVEGFPVEIIESLTGGHFFIDNERAYCLNDAEYIGLQTVPVISSDILRGTPVREQTFVHAELSFTPWLAIGTKVKLACDTAKDLNHEYKVTGIHHRGTISESVSGDATTTVTLSDDGSLNAVLELQ